MSSGLELRCQIPKNITPNVRAVTEAAAPAVHFPEERRVFEQSFDAQKYMLCMYFLP